MVQTREDPWVPAGTAVQVVKSSQDEHLRHLLDQRWTGGGREPARRPQWLSLPRGGCWGDLTWLPACRSSRASRHLLVMLVLGHWLGDFALQSDRVALEW